MQAQGVVGGVDETHQRLPVASAIPPRGQPSVRNGLKMTLAFTASPDPGPAPDGPSAAFHQLPLASKAGALLYTPPPSRAVFWLMQLPCTALPAAPYRILEGHVQHLCRRGLLLA